MIGPTGLGAVYVRRSDGTADTYYLTTDQLGSTDKILKAAGSTLQVAESFAPYWKLGVAYSDKDGFSGVASFDRPNVGPDANGGLNLGTSIGAQLTDYGKPATAITSSGTCRAHW